MEGMVPLPEAADGSEIVVLSIMISFLVICVVINLTEERGGAG